MTSDPIFEPLGREFEQVLEDNFWDLVIKSEGTPMKDERPDIITREEEWV